MTRGEARTARARDKATAKRRSRILEAAVICFLERGYHQTGVRDIAAKAGVSLGNLYNHFSGKHDVLVEIAALERTEQEPFLKILAGRSPATQVLDKFVIAYAKYLAAPENVILSIEITSEAIRQPDIGRLFLENRAELADAVTTLLERGIAEGDFRRLPDTDETSQLIIEAIEASAYRSVLMKAPMSKITRSVRDFVLASVLSRD